jgi:hypothetical protein
LIGALIGVGALITALVVCWLLYVFIVDPDIWRRMSGSAFKGVAAAGVAGVLFATLPAILSREPEQQPAVDEPVLTVSAACDALWEQFLAADPGVEFKLWATWDRFCG